MVAAGNWKSSSQPHTNAGGGRRKDAGYRRYASDSIAGPHRPLREIISRLMRPICSLLLHGLAVVSYTGVTENCRRGRFAWMMGLFARRYRGALRNTERPTLRRVPR